MHNTLLALFNTCLQTGSGKTLAYLLPLLQVVDPTVRKVCNHHRHDDVDHSHERAGAGSGHSALEGTRISNSHGRYEAVRRYRDKSAIFDWRCQRTVPNRESKK